MGSICFIADPKWGFKYYSVQVDGITKVTVRTRQEAATIVAWYKEKGRIR